MIARFEKFAGPDGQFYFRLMAPDNQNILTSGAYLSAYACDNGITSVRANAPYDSRYERSSTPGGLWFFNLHGTNGHTAGISRMFMNSREMESGITAVKYCAPYAPVIELI
jgi:uncharacterized protein YegP (UPF0339 family)